MWRLAQWFPLLFISAGISNLSHMAFGQYVVIARIFMLPVNWLLAEYANCFLELFGSVLRGWCWVSLFFRWRRRCRGQPLLHAYIVLKGEWTGLVVPPRFASLCAALPRHLFFFHIKTAFQWNYVKFCVKKKKKKDSILIGQFHDLWNHRALPFW